jgi:nitroreductase
VAFDGHTSITREAFCQILLKVLPGKEQIPFATLPWRPRVDLLLFVHRVSGMVPGLYALLRDPLRKETLQQQMMPSFLWTAVEACPASLPLFLLEAGDARQVAAQTSCEQDIASDGVLATAMLADYRVPLETLGPWFYRRLYWEAGMVGQQLYLEAEASGIRATGIGCFFDDLTHRTFGIQDDRSQVLYHLTMGGALEDPRIQTAPPYRHLPSTQARLGR